MTKITIQLLVDNSPASQEAKLILDQIGVDYVALPSSSAGLPVAIVGHQTHAGLSAIWRLATSIRDTMGGGQGWPPGV